MRKLMWLTIGYAMACALISYFLPLGFYLNLIIVCALIFLVTLFIKVDIIKILGLISFGVALAFLAFAYNYVNYIIPSQNLAAETLELKVRALENADSDSVLVEIVDENIASIDVQVYSYSYYIGNIKVDDEFYASFSFSTTDTIQNEKVYTYYAEGIYLKAVLKSEPLMTSIGRVTIFNFPIYLAEYIKEEIIKIFPEDTVAFMTAIMTGDKTLLYEDDDTYTAMNSAGILHIVAVSGMHLTVLWLFMNFITGRKKFLSTVLGLGVVWFFAMVVGATPSACRAAFMLTIIQLAPIFKREADSLTALSFALLVLLILNPYAITSISLQLSFSAMLGLILFSGKIYKYLDAKIYKFENKRLNRIRFYIISCLSSSLGISVFVMPLCAYHFGYVSLVSILTNVFVLFAVSFVFLGGYLSIALSALGLGTLAANLALAVAYIPRYIIGICELLSAIPYSCLYIVNVAVIYFMLAVYFLFFAAYFLRHVKYIFPEFPVIVLVMMFSFLVYDMEIDGNIPKIQVVDVGQGQAVLISNSNAVVLCDCGSSSLYGSVGDEVAEILLSNGKDTIDVLVISHMQEDHANGVVRLLSRIDVETIVISENTGDYNSYYEEVTSKAFEKDVEIVFIDEKLEINLDGIYLDLTRIASSDENDNSIIVRAEIEDYEALVMGDVSSSVELDFLDYYDEIDVDMLVVAHHGSRYSSCLEFLREIQAETAVISVGYNSYGHPTQETLDRLSVYSDIIYRTDLDGTVVIEVEDGEK